MPWFIYDIAEFHLFVTPSASTYVVTIHLVTVGTTESLPTKPALSEIHLASFLQHNVSPDRGKSRLSFASYSLCSTESNSIIPRSEPD